MDTKHFFMFLRINFPTIEITQEDALEIGEDFKKYLQEVYKGKEDKMEAIWDINPVKAIINKDHPLMTNGYNSALVFHFCNYVEKTKKELENEIAN